MFYTKDEFTAELSELLEKASLEYKSECAMDRLYTICTRLDECSKKFNLTAITEPSEVLKKHIADSLFCAKAIEELGSEMVLDVGSGAGFPSLPMAAVLPKTQVTALDSTAKKTVYMKETADLAGITNFSSVASRAEEAAKGEMREAYDAVCARAVARLSVLMELCVPFVRVGGYFVAMKAAAAKEELEEAKSAAKTLGCTLKECRQYSIPGLDDARFLLIYQKNSSTKAIYPRNYSQISKKPL